MQYKIKQCWQRYAEKANLFSQIISIFFLL